MGNNNNNWSSTERNFYPSEPQLKLADPSADFDTHEAAAWLRRRALNDVDATGWHALSVLVAGGSGSIHPLDGCSRGQVQSSAVQSSPIQSNRGGAR